jgi:hypothetical protein
MPTPSGSRSRRRIGGGLTISNARKSIKPSNRECHVIGAAIRVTSWPATSSITTNCGSFRPLARATRVAAGIPARTARAASDTAAQGRHCGAIERARTHHNRTINAELQVPGPGRKRPTPKKVATSAAQRGAAGRSLIEQAPVLVAPGSCRLSGGSPAHPQDSSSDSFKRSSLPSPVSCTGDEIT